MSLKVDRERIKQDHPQLPVAVSLLKDGQLKAKTDSLSLPPCQKISSDIGI